MMTLEPRVVLSLSFSGLAGIAIDPSGDIFVSYNSTGSTQQQSIYELPAQGRDSVVFTTTGSSASPGALAEVGSGADDLPVSSASDLLELEPGGELFDIDPALRSSSQNTNPIVNLAGLTADTSDVFDLQMGSSTDLGTQISLAGATYGDFGIDQDALVVSAVSDGWDLVARVTYSDSTWSAKVLVASPIAAGLSDAPGGVAVDSDGTVLTTMSYVPPGSTAGIDVPVGFNIDYDTGSTPSPSIPTLGLSSIPEIDSGGIAVDSEDNFILAAKDSSLYGGGPGVVHINDALTAFLADPVSDTQAVPNGMAYQDVGGTNYLAYTDAASGTYTVAGELSLFSGQVSPAQLRNAYGINQITFPGPGDTTVVGDGSGQTIAIVEEGVDPTLQADLNTFDQYYGIPAPPNFQIVDQDGSTTQNLDIVGEASLDVEWAHAIAPGASIIVYNAEYDPNNATTSYENLLTAMKQASEIQGVSVVTLSYGLPEASLAQAGIDETTFDSDFSTPGVTFLAAAGDTGIYVSGTHEVSADYPAASPDVVAVGGTSVTFDAAGDYPGTGSSGEVAWGDGTLSGIDGGGGGGLSADEAEPSWQTGVVPGIMDSGGTRALPDVSMDSGAAQPYDVFTSTLSGSSVSAAAVGWLGDAGTSAASPIWAGLIAIADQGRALEGGSSLTGSTQTLPALYSLPSADFHDIVDGSNGDPAETGYDLATGLGTPVANLLVPALAAYDLPSQLSITTEPPASVVAGSPFSLTVQVEDGQGQAIGGGTVAIAMGNNPGGAILGGPQSATVTDGVATFSGLSLSQPGTGYTLTLTYGDLSQTTTSFDVTANTTSSDGTQIGVSASPAAPAFGQALTITATVSVVSPGTGVPTGSVTFMEGSTTLGTVALTDGVAQLTTTPSAVGAETITVDYSGDDQSSSVQYPLTVGQATATLSLGNLLATYDGSPQFADATTSPAGLSGVVLTYSQDGVAVADPTRAGTYTVTATLDNADYTAAPATAALVIGQASPTITWSAPGPITAGTPLGSAQLDATASFDGATLSGAFTYDPPAGSLLSVGNGRVLTVIFSPLDSTDFKTVTASVTIDVLPQPTPTPTPTPTAVTIIGEQPVFRRKLNRHGKPTGKAVLTGFTIDFSGSLASAAASNSANYDLEVARTREVKGRSVRTLVPFTDFNVSYAPSSDSATITLGGAQTFPDGGRLAILLGVTNGSGSLLIGNSTFTITAGGKKLEAP